MRDTPTSPPFRDPPERPPGSPAESQETRSKGLSARWTYGILIVAFLFVLMPFLFWHATWFGRPLTDEEIERDFADAQHPRKAQHALSQIADRMMSSNPAVRESARRWYPQVLALGKHRAHEIRLTAAWVMGQDNSVPEFHKALLTLLDDADPMVRRNAALSLVRFRDAAGLPEIRAMLDAFAVRAPRAGILAQRLKPGDAVNPGTLIGRIQADEQEQEIRCEVPGTLERWVASDDSPVQEGDVIVTLSPSPEMVWEALRALVLIGTTQELPGVERYARGVEGMPDLIRRQAGIAAEAIRSRTEAR